MLLARISGAFDFAYSVANLLGLVGVFGLGLLGLIFFTFTQRYLIM